MPGECERARMTDGFDLDLQTVEQELEDVEDEEGGASDRRIVLGELDGTTDESEWLDHVERGNVLVLSIEGDLNELAADLAPRVDGNGGSLVHFRGFLIVTPADVTVDTDRL